MAAPNEKQQRPSIDHLDYLRIFLKRKWLIGATTLCVMGLIGLYVAFAPKLYKATTTLLVRRQETPFVWVGEANPLHMPEYSPIELETQAKIAGSSECAESAAQILRQNANSAFANVSAAEIHRSIATSIEQPDLLKIEAKHSNPQFAIEFANAVAKAFLAKTQELRRIEATAAHEFLVKAAQQARQELKQAEAELAAFQKRVGLILPQEETKNLLEQLRTAQEQIAEAEAAWQAAQHEWQILRQRLARTPPYHKVTKEAVNPRKENLRQAWQETQAELTRLQSRYTEKWPAVQELQEQLQRLQNQFAQEPETIVQTVVEPVAEYAALRQELIQAERKMAETGARVHSARNKLAVLLQRKRLIPNQLAQLQRLLDRVELAKEAFSQVQTQLQNARLNQAMKRSPAEIIDPAKDAQDISLQLKRWLIYSFVLGLASGLVVALFLELMDDTLRTPEDIARYTEVAFLGLIPRITKTEAELIAVTAPKSVAAEAFRALRTNIRFSLIDYPARTFLVTSTGAGEGKTSVAANLGLVLAQAGHKVLLMETDLRRPHLHHLFRLSADWGLTNVLLGDAELSSVMQPTTVEGLFVIPSGPLPPHPAELLDSERMANVIAQATALADIVICDSPPALVVTDAVVLSAKLERTLLVVEAGKVSREAFNEMCRLINNARGIILGCVLNKVQLSSTDYYYRYYYHEYERYTSAENNTDYGA